MLDELHAETAGIEGEDGAGIARFDLRQLGGEIELRQRRIDFRRDRALIEALQAGDDVLARRVVRRDQIDVLQAFFLQIGAHAFGPVVTLP